MKANLRDYKNVHLSSSLISLYVSTIFRQIGSSLIGLFGVIFFFEQFGSSVQNVVILFLLLFLAFGLFVPLSARLIHRLGMKRMMMIAMPLFALAILSLYFWDNNPHLFLALYFIFLTIHRLLFWVPYHVEFATFTDRKTRGKQIAFLSNISQIGAIIIPVIAGFIVSSHGYSNLFFISVIVLAIAIIPLYFIKETYERYEWGWWESFKKIFKKENRALLVGHASTGMQDVVGFVIWPIFIFLVLQGEYLSVGIVSSLVIIAFIVLRFIVGGLADRLSKDRMLTIGSFFAATGWFLKIFVTTGFHIFLADTYHKFGKVVSDTVYTASFYEQAADNHHYVDEYTVLREVALNMGRVIMLLLALLVLQFFGITAIFILAGIATFFISALTKRTNLLS